MDVAFKHGRVCVGRRTCVGFENTAGAKTQGHTHEPAVLRGSKWRVWIIEQQTRARKPLGFLQQGRAILKMGLSREVANLWSSYDHL